MRHTPYFPHGDDDIVGLAQGIRLSINQDLQQYGREAIGLIHLAVSHLTYCFFHLIHRRYVGLSGFLGGDTMTSCTIAASMVGDLILSSLCNHFTHAIEASIGRKGDFSDQARLEIVTRFQTTVDQDTIVPCSLPSADSAENYPRGGYMR